MIRLSIGAIEDIELVTEDGKRHNIIDLCREDYETFLAKMVLLEFTYKVLASTGAARGEIKCDPVEWR